MVVCVCACVTNSTSIGQLLVQNIMNSVSVCVCLCANHMMDLFDFITENGCLPECMARDVSVYVCLSLSVCVCVCLFVSLLVHVSVYACVCVSVVVT